MSTTETLYCLCWHIGVTEGRGNPYPRAIIEAWVEHLNDEHGIGTHWMEVA